MGILGSLHPEARRAYRDGITKIAHFDWEIPRIERETLAYRLLDGYELAPRFLGHVHEHGRVIGFLLERIEAREAGVDDLLICQSVLQRVHDLGILNGDVNRYSFLVRGKDVKMIDFENSRVDTDARSAMQMEMDGLRGELMEESGRGGGFRFEDTS